MSDSQQSGAPSLELTPHHDQVRQPPSLDLTVIIEQLTDGCELRKLARTSHASTCPSWSIGVYVFHDRDLVMEWNTAIEDATDQDGHTAIRFYLNEILAKRYWLDDQAQKASSLIRQYAFNLLKSLEIADNWDYGMTETRQIHLTFEILCHKAFFERDQGNASSTATSGPFHSLHWELLEDVKLWRDHKVWDHPLAQTDPMKFVHPKSVKIRRRIDMSDRTPGDNTQNSIFAPVRSLSDPILVNAFNILLVVARDVTKEVDAWSPTVIQAAILKIQDELMHTKNRRRIVVQVVRPGSHTQLKAILNGGVKFNVVHFDMHGRISPRTRRAELQFNERGDNGLAEDWVEGEKIAELMAYHDVQCVVVGACKSAHAESNSYANLAWLLVKNGVSNVLAMSFNMVDTMSMEYFNRFYFALFVEQHELSEAARLARQKLLRKPQRYHYFSTQWKDIDDWFVPVVYSDGRTFFAEKRKLHVSNAMDHMVPHESVFAQLIWLSSAFGAASVLFALRQMIAATVLGIGSACISMAVPHWLGKWRERRREDFSLALNNSMEDKTNILRLENELKSARKVYFYDMRQSDKDAGNLLKSLLPIWRRTNFIECVVKLDSSLFVNSFDPQRLAADWRIRLWKMWMSRSEHDPHLIVVVENVHKLYKDETDSIQFQARTKFEDWLEQILSPNGDKNSGPLLILTGLSDAGIGLQDRPQATKIQIVKRFDRVNALKDMSVTMFAETDPRFIITRN